ncbi:cytochrome-c oxidase, cbb3-type subunit I [Candidatus Walczuchella monophlebidarum]|uniref:cytochrome-c oxidase n=1 Tax=Candidatus Walczuchella monophlebidarum TaxID=1415657 RepID=A0A068DQ42_9FLAO|nr:cytochrome-c oxidase, cbb3-type subunit I [Candidatus Walczuchella monophlebidarum]AID37322.1 cbb3-type cytochrome c oxidase subunits CcoN/CcoO [Candidatus Walczuchella monophlebidarum]
MKIQKFYYDNRIVKAFLYATGFWMFVGFIAGLIIALMLFYPQLPEFVLKEHLKNSFGMLGYGRWRMLHTNTVVFAFVGNLIFTGSYYSLQRLLKTRMFSDALSWIHFYGWQLMIGLTWITYLLGINTSKEYAEHEWPLDILIAIVWCIYGVNLIGTLLRRRVQHMYVSIWFFLGTWVAVLVLHIFNNIGIPIALNSLKSYSIYAGVQDALVQWWYGHNAVAFILTTPILGLMYYFIPKASGKPVFSYKLSIIHFWSLIFVYIWAGPHHLIYTSLPGWAQMLGTIFSIMLIAPSWGGMLNGLLTLRGAWDKVRENPILKFFVVSVTCYGMATFEGPMLATKTLNSIVHFSDWIISHVHIGALGWNGFMAFGVIYWLVKRLWNTRLYSTTLANIHFWIGTIGIIFYVIPLYCGAVIQATMWKEFNPDGTLVHKNFLDTVTAIVPFYKLRFIGGILYFTGVVIMAYNIYRTIRIGRFIANEPASAVSFRDNFNKINFKNQTWLEQKPIQFTILSLIVVSIGSIVEIIPPLIIKSNRSIISSVKPYSPLELEGRDIYIREGCNACHSQIVRPFRDEVVRYGEYSKAGEFVYDHPFLWGSKRTGPDLVREGGKNPSSWHLKHMYNPRSTSPGSIMPRYPWLIFRKLNTESTINKMRTMIKLGVPYTAKDITQSQKNMAAQAAKIVTNIYNESPEIKPKILYQKKKEGKSFIPLENREIIALIAYLQKIGTDIKSIER